MVLDDKLVAHHRRVLVRLFSDPHVDAIRPNFFASRCADVVAFFPILLLPFSARTLKAPSCFLWAKGQAAVEWRVTLLLVGGVHAPDQRHSSRTGEKQLALFTATYWFGVRVKLQPVAYRDGTFSLNKRCFRTKIRLYKLHKLYEMVYTSYLLSGSEWSPFLLKKKHFNTNPSLRAIIYPCQNK